MSLTGGGQALTIDSGSTTLQLNLTAATLSVLQQNAGNNILDNYFLFTLGSGVSSGMFTDLTLSIDDTLYTAAITGGSADFTQFGLGFDLSYAADSSTNTLTGGHDVAVEVVAVVPEPSTYAMLALGLSVLLFGFRTTSKRQS